jgi:hypothetical protein
MADNENVQDRGEEFWYRGKVTRRLLVGVWRRRDRSDDADAGTVARRLRPSQAI